MSLTRPLNVFLCHASADKPAVRKVYRYLKERKIDPWLDAIDLIPGQNWREEIPKAIKNSEAIIVFLSKNSINKEGYVQREIKFALDKAGEMPSGKIFLIPAKLEDCDVPDELADYQWVNLFEEDGSRRLLKSLRLRAEQIGAAKVSTQGQDTSLPAILPETQKDSSIDVDGDVSGANIIVGNNNVIHVMPKPEPTSTSYEAEKIAREEVEREEREKIEQEAKEKLAREKTEHETIEKIELEKAELETVEKAQREKVEQETKEKLARENAEREVVAKAAREKTEREKAEKIAREKKEREAASSRVVEPKKPASKIFPIALSSFGLLFIAGIFVVIAVIVANNLPTSAQPTPTLGIGSIMNSEKDGAILVYVPEGEFTMGSDSGTSDEQPVHTVYLDAFWIDQTEVTNKLYAACVSDGGCTPPDSTSSSVRSSYYGNSEFDEFPVVYVDWNQANAYCLWAGRELPTEAQWEKAARGTDARIYPWGNDAPNKDLLNYNSNIGDTTKVGSYETGKSFYGAYDMAGNVWEWVNDWYGYTYFSQGSSSSNPLGPNSGLYRVLRGSAWHYSDNSFRSADRGGHLPLNADYDIGFRCALSISP